MTPITPLVSPPRDDLVNALQIASISDVGTLGEIRRLLYRAMENLSEPQPCTVELTRRYLEASAHDFGDVTDREARDLAQVILNSALRWERP